MFLIGWARPSIGQWMKSVGTTPYLVAFAFFMNGFALSTESLLGSLKKWRVLCVSLPITFVISPAIVFAARAIIPGGDSLIAHGFQIVSLLPTLFVSAVLITRMAKGNAAVALYLTIASNLLAIVVTPMLIKLTLPGSSTQLDLASTTVSMIFTVLIPTILGQLARKKWEVWAGSHARLITVISQCTILIFIITGVSALPRSVLTPSVVSTAVVGGIILHAALIGVSRIGGMVVRADERTKRALTFCCAQKSFVFNVLLCEHTFGGNSKAFGLAILPGI
ncbi:MAG TPA: bile acid:sodium symporter, partial [Armatimonadota bacterium]